jgi:predicted TIM-barrel fold metal-dependent hydrolase
MKDNPGGAIALIQKLYFDTAEAWNKFSLPSLAKPMSADHIVFGSDFPAASQLDATKGRRAFFPDDALAKIERGNARSILAAMG